MSKLTLFYNDACSKCRATIALVEKSGRPFEIVEYLKTPLTADQLKRLGLPLASLVRKSEPRFKELGLDKNPPDTAGAGELRSCSLNSIFSSGGRLV